MGDEHSVGMGGLTPMLFFGHWLLGDDGEAGSWTLPFSLALFIEGELFHLGGWVSLEKVLGLSLQPSYPAPKTR